MQTFFVTFLPTVIRELGDMHLYGWVVSGYMLASIVTTPLFSRITDVLGYRPLYLGGMAVFSAGALLSGFTGSMIGLIAFRVIMGMGVRAIMPSALAAVGVLFPLKSRGKIFGVINTVQLLASAAGPILGG